MKPIRLTVFSDEEKQAIHEATVEILERVGVRVYDDYLRGVMRRHGANVDDATGDVRLSAGQGRCG